MNERELFLYELNGRGFEFKDKTFNENGFNDEVLNMVYEMWQASANRQGYKLVPVDPTEDMLKTVETEKECIFEVSNDYCNIGIPSWICSDIYKSMIDAVGN